MAAIISHGPGRRPPCPRAAATPARGPRREGLHNVRYVQALGGFAAEGTWPGCVVRGPINPRTRAVPSAGDETLSPARR